jgi:hypothetical protein
MLTDKDREAAEDLLARLRSLLQPRPAPQQKYAPQRDGMTRYGIKSRTMWWKIRRRPDFPPTIKLGPKTELIDLEKTDAFMESLREP